jgi:hypothetical protein
VFYFNELYLINMRRRAYVPEERGGGYEKRGGEYEAMGGATNKPLFQGPVGHPAGSGAGRDMRKWAYSHVRT